MSPTPFTVIVERSVGFGFGCAALFFLLCSAGVEPIVKVQEITNARDKKITRVFMKHSATLRVIASTPRTSPNCTTWMISSCRFVWVPRTVCARQGLPPAKGRHDKKNDHRKHGTTRGSLRRTSAARASTKEQGSGRNLSRCNQTA